MTDGIELTATEWTVSVSEKRSTGEYENIEPHASLSGELPEDIELTEENRAAIRQQLLDLQHDLEAVIGQVAANRNKAADFEDWSDPLGDTDD